MKNSRRALKALFFILLLVLPLQVFANEKESPLPHGDEKTEVEDETSNEHGDDGQGEVGHEDESHGEFDDPEQGKETGDHGNGRATDHGNEETDETDGHGNGDDPEYQEPGANAPILGAFAAINGGIILFGTVRKLNKKKESGVK